MQKLLYFVVNGMAGYLDFGMGVLIAGIANYIWGSSSVSHLLIGGVLAFLPDFDIVYQILARRTDRIHEHHTSPLHRPLIVLPVVTAVAYLVSQYLVGNHYWTFVAPLCVAWHYIHDMPELGGGGLQTFWPLSKREWSFTGPHDPIEQIPLLPWLENWYKASPMSFLETLFGTMALSLGFGIAYQSWITASIMFAVPLVGTYFVWGLSSIYRK